MKSQHCYSHTPFHVNKYTGVTHCHTLSHTSSLAARLSQKCLLRSPGINLGNPTPPVTHLLLTNQSCVSSQTGPTAAAVFLVNYIRYSQAPLSLLNPCKIKNKNTRDKRRMKMNHSVRRSGAGTME